MKLPKHSAESLSVQPHVPGVSPPLTGDLTRLSLSSYPPTVDLEALAGLLSAYGAIERRALEELPGFSAGFLWLGRLGLDRHIFRRSEYPNRVRSGEVPSVGISLFIRPITLFLVRSHIRRRLIDIARGLALDPRRTRHRKT